MSDGKTTSSPASRASAETRLKEPNEIERSSVGPHGTAPSRAARISEAAYRLAQARGFAPGAELEDWLSAEREVDARDAGVEPG